MALHDVLATVVSERAATRGEKKHYIPFDVEEFEAMRKAFGRPNLMPNDLKLVLLALAAGQLELTVVKPKA